MPSSPFHPRAPAADVLLFLLLKLATAELAERWDAMVRMIITWSLHNRLVVLLGTLMLIATGLYCGYHLNVEAYPDPTPPLVEVITQNPGASPEEIERQICIPIEIALNGMPGLHHLRSTTVAGLSDIKCVFTYETDY
jgi:heavy metal efflux system protein